ncbi:hypothetical protein LCGC14_2263300 [marine sediment metagenome]|uniref:Uncharacterized protein n=1 Tax=marine sediment metagenome TaxID=412755 RepID=A0A0F9CZ91_9ZZZZ
MRILKLKKPKKVRYVCDNCETKVTQLEETKKIFSYRVVLRSGGLGPVTKRLPVEGELNWDKTLCHACKCAFFQFIFRNFIREETKKENKGERPALLHDLNRGG